MPSVGEVHFDQTALHLLLAAPAGVVARSIERRAIKVQARATELCPVLTGRLQSSITHHMGADAEGVYADVGTNVEYALYVEMGTSTAAAQPFLRPALDAGGADEGGGE